MTQQEIDAIADLSQAVAQRASGFAYRGSAIFNGSILAEELLDVAIKIRNLAPLVLKDVTPRPALPVPEYDGGGAA